MAYQMMQDLAILVHAQGEQIGLISENINKAQNYIQKAEKNMVSAKKNHQAARKVPLWTPNSLTFESSWRNRKCAALL